VSRRRADYDELRIREITIYIRTYRVHHAVKRRSKQERYLTSELLRKMRNDCWQSYRQLVAKREHVSQGSPWAFYSCRTSLKMGV
jgi:hypothetical protein